MATLGFGIIVYRMVLGTEFLGAADGISDVPGFPLLPGVVITGNSSSRVSNYYLAWGLVILGMVLPAEPDPFPGGTGARGGARRRGCGGSDGNPDGPLQVEHVRAERGVRRPGRCLSHPLQRRHRPVGGIGHEVGPVRRDRRDRRHGEPVGRPVDEPRAELPVAPGLFRDLRRCRLRRDPHSHHAVRARWTAAASSLLRPEAAGIAKRRRRGGDRDPSLGPGRQQARSAACRPSTTFPSTSPRDRSRR